MSKSENVSKRAEPLFHITKRSNVKVWRSILIRAAAILISVVVMAVIMVILAPKNESRPDDNLTFSKLSGCCALIILKP